MKIKMNAGILTITSSMKMDDIRTIEKCKPNALVLKNEDDDPVFAICTTCGKGGINNYGAEFGRVNNATEGLATIVMDVGSCCGCGDCTDEDIIEDVIDNFGAAFTLLEELEAKLPEALEAVNAERAAIKGMITVG